MLHVVIVTTYFERTNKNLEMRKPGRVQTLDCLNRQQAEDFAKALRSAASPHKISEDTTVNQTFEPGVVFYIGKKPQKIIAASDELSGMVRMMQHAMQV